MATATFSAAPDNTSDATFRDWGSKLSAAIEAVGLVKTADTGMPNWTTVTKPTSLQYVYECFRLNDSLQATVPIFLRIGYGTGGTATYANISIAVGKGTNGTNSLTSPIGTEQKALGFGPETSPSTWYVSSADGSQLFITSPLNQTFNSCVSVFFERSRGPSGAPTGTGGVFSFKTGNTLTTSHVGYSFNYANPAIVISASSPIVPGNTQYASLAIAGVAPVTAALQTDGFGAFWQSRAILAYVANDCTVAVPVTIPGFGVYLPLGANGGANAYNNRLAAAWS